MRAAVIKRPEIKTGNEKVTLEAVRVWKLFF